MAKDIRLIIVEADPFARNWAALLCARDWRTRVVGETSASADLPGLLRDGGRVDLILFDTDSPDGHDELPALLEIVSSQGHAPAILYTGIRPRRYVLNRLNQPNVRGYVIKDEIRYSLAWAVAIAVLWKGVITPGVLELAAASHCPLPKPCAILDGSHPIGRLTDHQMRAARLALLFSMERREMADELAISEEWSYGLVREIYKKLGLKELIKEAADPRDYLGDHELVLSAFEKIKREFHGKGKARDMETLAFHLITMPYIEELG